MSSNSVEVPKFFQVNFQLLKLQLLPLRRSHLYINLYRPSSHHLHSMQSNRVSNVCEITAIFLFWAPLPTQRITGNPFRISCQPDWQIDNSFVNRPVMVRLKSSSTGASHEHGAFSQTDLTRSLVPSVAHPGYVRIHVNRTSNKNVFSL